MVKCQVCGKSFSEKVFPHHYKFCKKKEEKKEINKKLTVTELKELCKKKGLTGYSKLKEQELIDLLKEGD